MRSPGFEGATKSNDTCLHEGQAEGNVREVAEDGVIRPRGRDRPWPPEAGGGSKVPVRSSRRWHALQHL